MSAEYWELFHCLSRQKIGELTIFDVVSRLRVLEPAEVNSWYLRNTRVRHWIPAIYHPTVSEALNRTAHADEKSAPLASPPPPPAPRRHPDQAKKSAPAAARSESPIS